MTINKVDFYLQNIELCKKLEPVMERLGIEHDDYYVEIDCLDKILAKLPDTPYNMVEKYLAEYGKDKFSKMEICTILKTLLQVSGQTKLNAAAKLLHLLWKEGLVK